MTLKEKCDSCRKLKVKCDEKKPRCGGCVKRQRDCTRSYSGAHRFVPDKLSSAASRVRCRAKCDRERSPPISETSDTSEAKCTNTNTELLTFAHFIDLGVYKGGCTTAAGHDDRSSEFQFEITRLERQPTSESDRLLRRWCSMMNVKAGADHHLDMFGTWHTTVHLYVGQSTALDRCLETLLDNMDAFAAGTYSVPAELSVNKAARSTAEAIAAQGGAGPSTEILLAGNVLYVTSIFRHMRRGIHYVHLEALIYMIKQHSVTGNNEDMNHRLFRDFLVGDFSKAMHVGRDNVFDSTRWLDIPAPELYLVDWPAYGFAWKSTQNAFILIPRLARLVRQLSEASVPNPQIQNEAVVLALYLYTTNLELDISQLLLSGTITAAPTTLYWLSQAVPTSFFFSSSRVYFLAVFYWTTRVLICGLVQQLCEIDSSSAATMCLLDLPMAREQDRAAATNLLMSVQYAHSTGLSCLPTAAVLLIMPLHVAFGAWHRADIAEGHSQTNLDMKAVVVEAIRSLADRWDCGVPTVEDLERKAACYAGGPLMEDIKQDKESVHRGYKAKVEGA